MGLVVAAMATGAWAQAGLTDAKGRPVTIQTYYLSNISAPADANEVLATLRNLLDPSVKVYLVPMQNAVVVEATAEQMAVIQKVIHDLDRPKKMYRLTYTINDMDGNKRVGTQHFTMIAMAGQRTTLKQGTRIPVVTGTYNSNSANTSAPTNQVQYLDVGMNIDATLAETSEGGILRSRVEQSNVATETSGVGVQDPVIRQTVLDGASAVMPGKTAMLGSVEVPGSTRHLEVEVMMEPVV